MPACDDSISSKMLTIIIDRMRASYETFTSHDSRRAGRGEGEGEREREIFRRNRARRSSEEKGEGIRLAIKGNEETIGSKAQPR